MRMIAAGAAAMLLAGVMAHVGSASGSPATRGCASANVIPTGEASRRQAVRAILCLVNAERAKYARSKVLRSGTLGRAAQAHSDDMARNDYLGHVSSTGKNLRQRVAATGYRAKYSGEALSWGTGSQASAAGLMHRLMDDLPHRLIVRSTRYRDVGIGLTLDAPVAGKANGATLTLVFGRRR